MRASRPGSRLPGRFGLIRTARRVVSRLRTKSGRGVPAPVENGAAEAMAGIGHGHAPGGAGLPDGADRERLVNLTHLTAIPATPDGESYAPDGESTLTCMSFLSDAVVGYLPLPFRFEAGRRPARYGRKRAVPGVQGWNAPVRPPYCGAAARSERRGRDPGAQWHFIRLAGT